MGSTTEAYQKSGRDQEDGVICFRGGGVTLQVVLGEVKLEQGLPVTLIITTVSKGRVTMPPVRSAGVFNA